MEQLEERSMDPCFSGDLLDNIHEDIPIIMFSPIPLQPIAFERKGRPEAPSPKLLNLQVIA